MRSIRRLCDSAKLPHLPCTTRRTAAVGVVLVLGRQQLSLACAWFAAVRGHARDFYNGAFFGHHFTSLSQADSLWRARANPCGRACAANHCAHAIKTPPKNCVSALRTFIPAPHTHALQLISHANARHSLYAFLHILLSFLQKPTFLVLSTIMTIKMFTLLMFSTLFLSFVFQVHFEYENLVCKQKKQL